MREQRRAIRAAQRRPAYSVVDSSYDLATAAALVSTAIAALLFLALAGVAVFVVRPARSSAATLIGVGAALALASLCISFLLPIGYSRIASSSEMGTFIAAQHLLGAAMHAVWFSCVLAGIVQLARANKSGPREGD